MDMLHCKHMWNQYTRNCVLKRLLYGDFFSTSMLSHALAGSFGVRQAGVFDSMRMFQKQLDSCCPLLCLDGVRDVELVGLWGEGMLRGSRPGNGEVFRGTRV
jgi:hypothetical protein